ncbi:MAG TPA: peptidyl-prolyl cis-trans isomerase [Solirubrobacterales bacterium]|nr:peptidyl-prolyl cis-trans isomerase [Solirubrobacterales bacterium]
MGANQGQRNKSAGLQRLALVVFGALFVLLFAIFAIAEGIGDPSIPADDVAVVEGVPEEIGHISKEEFERALVPAAAEAGLKAPPKPGDKKYEEVKDAALGELIDSVWIQGQAEEMGIEVTDKQIATELEQIKKQNFKTEAAFQKFLEESKYTAEDVDKRVRLQILSTQIQQQLTGEAPTVGEDQVEEYYDEAKSTQFTQPASRDVRAIVNKDEKKLAAAKAALDKDDSPKNWKVVAKKFSEDPFTKTTGGLQAGVTAESGRFPENVEEAIFAAEVLQVEGPIKAPETGAGYVFQVEKTTPEKVQPLKEVKSQISTQLTQEAQQESFGEFVSSYQSRWTAETFCADGFVIERCSNDQSSGRPESAPPACYEEDPKGGVPKDCPAPVLATQPARPGSVSILTPQGERLPQRPRPVGLKEEEAGAAAGLEGLPPGTEIPVE